MSNALRMRTAASTRLPIPNPSCQQGFGLSIHLVEYVRARQVTLANVFKCTYLYYNHDRFVAGVDEEICAVSTRCDPEEQMSIIGDAGAPCMESVMRQNQCDRGKCHPRLKKILRSGRKSWTKTESGDFISYVKSIAALFPHSDVADPVI